MSVTARLVLSVLLLAVGVGLPAWAIQTRGPPWSFQDRSAVVLSRTGNVEVYGGTSRPSGTGAVDARPGVWLYAGDEVRVGALSRVVLRTPRADVELADGARTLIGEQGALSLARGLLFVEVSEGEPLLLRAESMDASIELLPGAYRLTANGQGRVFVFVEKGAASSSKKRAEAGHLLALQKGGEVDVQQKPVSVPLQATVDVQQGLVRGKTAAGAQLYVNGKLLHAGDDGAFSEALPPGNGDVVVFVRDPAGNIEHRSLLRPSGENRR